MKNLLLIALILLPSVADATSLLHRKDVSRNEKQMEYACIAEGRDKSWDELRACVKEKKGTSLITIEKFWESDPKERKLRVQ